LLKEDRIENAMVIEAILFSLSTPSKNDEEREHLAHKMQMIVSASGDEAEEADGIESEPEDL
jgi:hypothetical protein